MRAGQRNPGALIELEGDKMPSLWFNALVEAVVLVCFVVRVRQGRIERRRLRGRVVRIVPLRRGWKAQALNPASA